MACIKRIVLSKKRTNEPQRRKRGNINNIKGKVLIKNWKTILLNCLFAKPIVKMSFESECEDFQNLY